MADITDIVAGVETIVDRPALDPSGCPSSCRPRRSTRLDLSLAVGSTYLGINVVVTDGNRADSESADRGRDTGRDEAEHDPGEIRVERERPEPTGDTQAAKNRDEDPPA